MAKFITTDVNTTQLQSVSFAELIMSSGALGFFSVSDVCISEVVSHSAHLFLPFTVGYLTLNGRTRTGRAARSCRAWSLISSSKLVLGASV